MGVRRTIQRYLDYFRTDEGRRESERVAEGCRRRGISVKEYMNEIRERVKRKMAELTWKCHICGDIRPDDRISVRTTDISAKSGLPPGTMQQNVRYCNDREKCIEGAKTFSFVKD